MIVKSYNVCGGRARVNGTRLAVWFIICILKTIDKKEAIDQFPSLTLEDIDSAIEYYNNNKNEIDKDISDQEDYVC